MYGLSSLRLSNASRDIVEESLNIGCCIISYLTSTHDLGTERDAFHARFLPVAAVQISTSHRVLLYIKATICNNQNPWKVVQFPQPVPWDINP